jgi:hypothetical protein
VTELGYVKKFAHECCVEVARKGEWEPCGKPASGVTVDPEDPRWWPVCPHHSRGRQMVPLTKLLQAVYEDARAN